IYDLAVRLSLGEIGAAGAAEIDEELFVGLDDCIAVDRDRDRGTDLTWVERQQATELLIVTAGGGRAVCRFHGNGHRLGAGLRQIYSKGERRGSTVPFRQTNIGDRHVWRCFVVENRQRRGFWRSQDYVR